jgi:hypothetical protein
MLRAIAAAKKKNDLIDPHKVVERLRCEFLPEGRMNQTGMFSLWTMIPSAHHGSCST